MISNSFNLSKVLRVYFPLFLFVQISALAQSFEYQKYSWQEKRNRIEVSTEEAAEPAIIIKNLIANEYTYEENKGLFLYTTVHKIVRVNTNEAIENYNKIYIPMNDVIDLLEIKARSISPSGETVVLDKNSIKEIQGEEKDYNYRQFAIEGVEAGSEIEYFYTLKKTGDYFGRERIQTTVPTKNLDFQIISPKHLIFECKGYNNAPALHDTIYNDKRFLKASVKNVPALQPEEFSNYNANLMRYDFKLAFNAGNADTVRLLTWKEAAERIYFNTHQVNKKEMKKAEGLFKSIKIKPTANDSSKIIAIENFVKTNFSLQEGGAEAFSILESVIDNKYGNVLGMVKLYLSLFIQAGIPYDVAVTSDRSQAPFDKDFDSWNYLHHYIFYFPTTGKYLSPEDAEYRYGMIPFNYTNQYALFIRGNQPSNTSSISYEIKFISPSSYKSSLDDLDISVALDEEMNKAEIDIKRTIGGYNAVYVQPYYPFLPEDRKKVLLESMVKSIAQDATFKEINVKNGELNLSPLKNPFIIDAKIESSSVLEKAGNNYLFKIGELLGPQTELYQEESRKTAIENDFNRMYNRTITFKIPDNYTIKNLDDLKMDVFYEEKGEKLFNFNSKYTLSGNSLKVDIIEYYKEINFPIEKFESFRKVINAAADFNKITLILSKK